MPFGERLAFLLCSMKFLRLNPMLPAVVALIVGILLAGWRTLPLWAAILFTLLFLVVAIVCSLRYEGGGVVPLLLSLLFLGFSLAQMRYRVGEVTSSRAVYLLTVDKPLHRHSGWWRGEGRLEAMCDEGDRWHKASGRIRLYADSVLNLHSPSRLTVSGRILPFRDSVGWYRRTMHRKGFVGTLFVQPHNLLDVEHGAMSGALLPRMHINAVERVAILRLPLENLAVAEALAVGDRALLSPDVRDDYSRSGVAHVLALSGLHVGMVLLVVNALCWWLPLFGRGHRVRNVVVIALLWSYMFMTGLSPSAVRAALMFTILQISLFSSGSYSGINSLSAAAFVSLCWNTDLLYDAGFQLSYIAVAAILLWGVPLCRRFELNNQDAAGVRYLLQRVANYLISTIIITIVATLATAPLVSHLFGVVSIVGVVLNPVVIALTTVAVASLVVWLFVPLEPLCPLFSLIVRLSTDGMNFVSGWLVDEPWATLDIRLDSTTTIAVYGLMVLMTFAVKLFVKKKEKKWVLK